MEDEREKVVPIVIGALGTVPKKLEEHLTDIGSAPKDSAAGISKDLPKSP